MEWKANLEELSKVSYLEIKELDGRIIPLQPGFNENNEWEMWLPGPTGLVKMQSTEPVESHYFAKDRVSEMDGYLDFSNCMLKRAYYPDVAYHIEAILDDLHNLGASVEKLELFFDDWQKEHSRVTRRFVSTELEYIFNVCRSMFDLLQLIIRKLWDRVRLLDEDENARKKQLKTSFAKMILTGDNLLSLDEIREKHFVPSLLAEFYYRQSGFFKWLRDYRDHILHHGKTFQFIFLTERGFAVSLRDQPFASLDIWNEKNTIPNKLGSVRSAVAYVITKTIMALEEFTQVLKKTIELPYDIAPNYHVFVRGRHNEALLTLKDYVEEQAWQNESS